MVRAAAERNSRTGFSHHAWIWFEESDDGFLCGDLKRFPSWGRVSQNAEVALNDEEITQNGREQCRNCAKLNEKRKIGMEGHAKGAYLDPNFFGLAVMIVFGHASVYGQLLAWRRAIVAGAGWPLPIFDLVLVHLG